LALACHLSIDLPSGHFPCIVFSCRYCSQQRPFFTPNLTCPHKLSFVDIFCGFDTIPGVFTYSLFTCRFIFARYTDFPQCVLSNTDKAFSLIFVTVQVSDPYATTDSISVWYIWDLRFLEINLDPINLVKPKNHLFPAWILAFISINISFCCRVVLSMHLDINWTAVLFWTCSFRLPSTYCGDLLDSVF